MWYGVNLKVMHAFLCVLVQCNIQLLHVNLSLMLNMVCSTFHIFCITEQIETIATDVTHAVKGLLSNIAGATSISVKSWQYLQFLLLHIGNLLRVPPCPAESTLLMLMAQWEWPLLSPVTLMPPLGWSDRWDRNSTYLHCCWSGLHWMNSGVKCNFCQLILIPPWVVDIVDRVLTSLSH